MKMINANDVAFKSSKNNRVLVFIKGEHVGSIDKSDNWYDLDIQYSGIDMNEHCLFASDKEQMRGKIANIVNNEIAFKAPFEKIHKASRITKKDINECIIKIVENSNQLSKEDIVRLLKGIIL